MSLGKTIPTLVNNFQYDILHDLLQEVASDDLLIPIIAKEQNFIDIEKGDPSAVFSELLWSLKIQMIQGQGADFLGRVYRFNEAYFKYIFARHEVDGPVDLFHNMFEENRILNRLLVKPFFIKYNIRSNRSPTLFTDRNSICF